MNNETFIIVDNVKRKIKEAWILPRPTAISANED